MRLSEGIEFYITRKRRVGFRYEQTEQTLAEFCRLIGELPLELIETHHIFRFLNASSSSYFTWRIKYATLRLFFEFWTDRGEMPTLVMPKNRALNRQPCAPYIYTQRQIRDLLRAVPADQKIWATTIDQETFRTFLLLLYGTGAMIREALQLQCRDVDLKRRTISLAGNEVIQSRRIPVCLDLRDILGEYMASKCRLDAPAGFLFTAGSGEPINRQIAYHKFSCLRQQVRILRATEDRFQPSLQDLRTTFAVHRIASWIKNGADLNQMLPALSGYMGLVGMTAIERYLSLTSERFQGVLNKLSPPTGKKHWRDQSGLMKLLAAL